MATSVKGITKQLPPNIQHERRHEPLGEGARFNPLYPTTNEYGIPIPLNRSESRNARKEWEPDTMESFTFNFNKYPNGGLRAEGKRRYLAAKAAYNAERAKRISEEQAKPKEENSVTRTLFGGGKKTRKVKAKKLRRKTRKH